MAVLCQSAGAMAGQRRRESLQHVDSPGIGLTDPVVQKSASHGPVAHRVAFSPAIKMLFVTVTFVGLALLWVAIADDTKKALLDFDHGLCLLKS